MYFIFLFFHFYSNSFVTFGGYAHNAKYDLSYGVQSTVFYNFFQIAFCGIYKHKINKNQAIGVYGGAKADLVKFSNSSLILNFYCEFFILGVKMILIIGPSINCSNEIFMDIKCMATYTEYKIICFAGIDKSFKIKNI